MQKKNSSFYILAGASARTLHHLGINNSSPISTSGSAATDEEQQRPKRSLKWTSPRFSLQNSANLPYHHNRRYLHKYLLRRWPHHRFLFHNGRIHAYRKSRTVLGRRGPM